MPINSIRPLLSGDPTRPPSSHEERLERGEILVFNEAPFSLPCETELAFLRQQRQQPITHKNIGYNPHNGAVSGYLASQHDCQAEWLQHIFDLFSRSVSEWVSEYLPSYRDGLDIDRASFRPIEEATRRIRITARNDLLHIDSFPNRPAFGRRLLRVFVNIHPTEERVWMSSYPFDELLNRYGLTLLKSVRSGSWLQTLRQNMLRFFHFPSGDRTPYDEFMVQFHNLLKRCDHLQEHGTKRIWTFPAGCVWMAMTDGFAHSVLRGQFALEHSFFVRSEVLACPEHAPATYLERAVQSNQVAKAA